MANLGWSHDESPFHEGELAIQSRLGIKDQMDWQGRRIIREYLPKQHRKFYAQLSYIILGTLDKYDSPWASILVGEPGFMITPDDRTLQIETRPLAGDPLNENLILGADIGVLGIELQTRRRNRMNGMVSQIDGDRFSIDVKQSFGNCPQYIQARMFEFVESQAGNSSNGKKIESLGESEQNLIANADTFFIASSYQSNSASSTNGVDVSHRGGKPGFVHIDDENTLTIPDFSGNGHFNTLGNLELNPRAGLLFVDFERGDLLYLTGTTEVIWSGVEISNFVGAEQLIRFHLKLGYLVKASLPLRWTPPHFSPFLQRTGSW